MIRLSFCGATCQIAYSIYLLSSVPITWVVASGCESTQFCFDVLFSPSLHLRRGLSKYIPKLNSVLFLLISGHFNNIHTSHIRRASVNSSFLCVFLLQILINRTPIIRLFNYPALQLSGSPVIRLSNCPDLFGPSSKHFLTVIVLHLFMA